MLSLELMLGRWLIHESGLMLLQAPVFLYLYYAVIN